MSEPVKSAKRLLSNVLAFIRSRHSMDKPPSHNPTPTDHLNRAPERPASVDHPDATVTAADIAASDTLPLPDTLAPLDSLLERRKSLLENSAPSAQGQPKQPAVRVQPPQEKQQTKQELATISDYIAAEVSLETIGYFVPSSKRIKDIDTKEEVVGEIKNSDGTKTQVEVSFIYSRKYGIPNTTDLDYYRAFLKILDECVEKSGYIPEPLELPTDKLIRYAGKQWRGGTGARKRTALEVRDFIQVNRYTGIQGYLYNAKTGKYAEVGEEPLFRKYVLRGEALEEGNIAQTNYVWLASWFRTNYEHHYVRTIDHAFHRRLRKPIAKALYPLLATGWHASGGQPYEKSYRALCQKFLLKEFKQISRIKQQLDPSHRELQGYLTPTGSKEAKKVEGQEYLSDWEYRRSADGQDWIITFHPGQKFFADKEAMLSRREVARSIPSSTKAAAARPARLASANHPADYEHFIEEISRLLGFYQNTDDLETKRKHALFKKWLRHYSYYGVIDQALSEYRHDTADLPHEKAVRQPMAYFQAVLHRTAHRQGMEWIRPCSARCQYRTQEQSLQI